jgi:hypothetical protein
MTNLKNPICLGDVIRIKQHWLLPGDEEFVVVAADHEANGSVSVRVPFVLLSSELASTSAINVETIESVATDAVFDEPITSLAQAKWLLRYLSVTDRCFHPEEDPQSISPIDAPDEPTFNAVQVDQLRQRMAEIHELPGFDPCGFVLDIHDDYRAMLSPNGEPESLWGNKAYAQKILVVVHPGSVCGSADFNLGVDAGAKARQALIREIQGATGAGVIVIDGDLSDELALEKYAKLDSAIIRGLERASNQGLISTRVLGHDPDQVDRIREAVEGLSPADRAREFVVTGAWYYESDAGDADAPWGEGCVGSVAAELERLGCKVQVSPHALRQGDVDDTDGSRVVFASRPVSAG